MHRIKQVRYNDEYVILIKHINNNFKYYSDVILYLNLLDEPWRLPNPVEINYLLYSKNLQMNYFLPYLLDDNLCYYGDDYSYYNEQSIQPVPDHIDYCYIILVQLIYKPTTFKRILLWLKNTTVANIVRKS
jgi:hypothetical protein